jgi:hypothetical protein
MDTAKLTLDPAAEAEAEVAPKANRRAYFGSCHCQFTRYIVWLTLPASPPYVNSRGGDGTLTPSQSIRQCNCTVCHKFGFFHVRTANAPRDFALLSPLDPLRELGDYTANSHGMHWLFCPRCGVRCFAVEGKGEVVERDLGREMEGVDLARARAWARVEGDGSAVKVWAVREEGWREEDSSWLRINARTLDARQEGLDLRQWHDSKWIEYVNWLDEIEGKSHDRPYEGGAY